MSVILSFLAVLAVLSVAFAATDPIKKYSISDVTVSGLSSGGYMAVQMHVAYSSVINGSAIFAGVSLAIAAVCVALSSGCLCLRMISNLLDPPLALPPHASTHP